MSPPEKPDPTLKELADTFRQLKALAASDCPDDTAVGNTLTYGDLRHIMRHFGWFESQWGHSSRRATTYEKQLRRIEEIVHEKVDEGEEMT
jgi:hypothetical protein